MPDEHTERLELPLLVPGQAHKEVFHNEALTLIDVHCHLAVEKFARDPEILVPQHGQSWVIDSNPQGVFADRVNQIACWTAGGWRFLMPVVGMLAYVVEERCRIVYFEGQWHRPEPIPSLAAGSVIDAQARSAIESITATLDRFGLNVSI